MKEQVVRRLVELNRTFYDELAIPFASSREGPQPGYEPLLAYLPDLGGKVLDVGCGNGRFGRFLQSNHVLVEYTGIDYTPKLLEMAGDLNGSFILRDVSCPGCLDGLGTFDLIVALSTLQHIPGTENRIRLLRAMREHLKPAGRIALANWQFTDSDRQARKIRPWKDIELQATDVEPGDYLLSWKRGGSGLRYVALIDATSTKQLADAAGLRIINQYRSDGREGNLNLYTILAS